MLSFLIFLKNISATASWGKGGWRGNILEIAFEQTVKQKKIPTMQRGDNFSSLFGADKKFVLVSWCFWVLRFSWSIFFAKSIGGSFNPPHVGHLRMMQLAHDALVE